MMNRIAGQTLLKKNLLASCCFSQQASRRGVLLLKNNAAAAASASPLVAVVQRASYSSSSVVNMAAGMDDLKTGTSAYMDLYPEKSTDGSLRLGNIIPDFSAETTHGKWESFHEWKKGKVRTLFIQK